MERVALDAGASHRRIQEAQVERRVVTAENRAPAHMNAQLLAHLAE